MPGWSVLRSEALPWSPVNNLRHFAGGSPFKEIWKEACFLYTCNVMLNQWLFFCKYKYVCTFLSFSMLKQHYSFSYFSLFNILLFMSPFWLANFLCSMSFGVLWPGFLPSSFSMYSVSLSSALFLLEKPAMAVSVASAGVILGWPFSILVVLPLTAYSLLSGRFKQVFLSAAATSLTILVRYNLYHFGSSDPLFIHIKGFRTWF